MEPGIDNPCRPHQQLTHSSRNWGLPQETDPSNQVASMQDLSLSNEAGSPAGLRMNRRQFLCALGASGALLDPVARALTLPSAAPGIKPVSGSWFEFQHHATVEGVDWNPACSRFTCEQWDAKIKEIAEAGMEYLVLMATALDYRCFFPTKIFPSWQLNCPEP